MGGLRPSTGLLNHVLYGAMHYVGTPYPEFLILRHGQDTIPGCFLTSWEAGEFKHVLYQGIQFYAESVIHMSLLLVGYLDTFGW